MKIQIIKYQKTNFADLNKCLINLMDYIVKIDNKHLAKRSKKYNPQYALNLVKKVKQNKGIIYLAFDENIVVGCIAGMIAKQTKEDLLECKSQISGRILELYVDNKYRYQGIGKMLMKKMEEYFKSKKCENIRVDVFAPNHNARFFYKKLHYQERAIDLLKVSNNPHMLNVGLIILTPCFKHVDYYI